MKKTDYLGAFKWYPLLSLLLLFVVAGCETSLRDTHLTSESGSLKKGTPGTTTPPYQLAANPTQMQVYGIWHAGNDYCTWSSVREITEFNAKNSWIINRGDGKPSVNLVVLSFVNPLNLLNNTTDNNPLGGIPVGMTPAIVNYFKGAGIRVMLSIGGITYTDYWNSALSSDAAQLGYNAAKVAQILGVGIEIDYEENTNANLTALQSFIDAYRSIHPYDPTGNNHEARLTIDLAAGDRWLIDICRKASADWLKTDNPVLDYANAMVPARQPSATAAIENWDEHIDGKPQYAPPIPPLAPCKFTGSLYISGSKATAECTGFYSSIQYTNRDFVTKIMSPVAGLTPGMLGYMFWAAECPSTRQLCVTDCKGGLGEGAKYFNIPIPMSALRQK